MTKRPLIRLQPARHKRVAGGHPWVYSNEIVMTPELKALPPGGMVQFLAHDGSLLGTGSFNPHTLIAGRIYAREPLATLDAAWLADKLRKAVALRDMIVGVPYYRLIHAEADDLPGVIIDRFGAALSVQLNTAGAQLLWADLLAALEDVLQPEQIVLHNDSPARAMEGLPREVIVVKGSAEQGPLPVQENGLTYFADIVGGQKTGWYYDQRDNHALMARFAKGKSVLDLYMHAGGFALLAAKAGASRVVGVDSSAPALALAQKAAEENALEKQCAWVRADVFDDIEDRLKEKEKFDIVIADPPPFVRARKDLAAGTRGYRKLACKAAGLVTRGGLLYIASCSHNMDLTLFMETVARGLGDAKRKGQVLFTTFAAPDHPVHPHLPESAYLKGFVIRLD